MPILFSMLESWLIYGGSILATLIVLFVIFYFTCGFRKKREKKNQEEHVVVDETFITSLMSALGGQDNVKSVSVDNGRLKFLVVDLDKLLTEELKTLSTSGVFITGNNVKLLFKYDSQAILNILVERGVEKC